MDGWRRVDDWRLRERRRRWEFKETVRRACERGEVRTLWEALKERLDTSGHGVKEDLANQRRVLRRRPFGFGEIQQVSEKLGWSPVAELLIR